MTLETMVEKLGFREEICEELFSRVSGKTEELEKLGRTAYAGENFDFQLCHENPWKRLAVVLYLLLEKYEIYQGMGIQDDIIFDTFQDVSLRADLYYEKTRKAGITEDDVIWFRHIMNAEIFKIGSIQFQCFRMLYLDGPQTEPFYMIYSDGVKKWLKSGTPVINCHIQQGADLSNESVAQSFDQARKFFKRYFPEKNYSYFLCYSWLLYPPMTTSLPLDSHIRNFAGRFQIIGTCTDAEQAMGNLFTEGESGKQETCLQQMARLHPERFGFACGIISL